MVLSACSHHTHLFCLSVVCHLICQFSSRLLVWVAVKRLFSIWVSVPPFVFIWLSAFGFVCVFLCVSPVFKAEWNSARSSSANPLSGTWTTSTQSLSKSVCALVCGFELICYGRESFCWVCNWERGEISGLTPKLAHYCPGHSKN